ncbi:5-(carboxyamino)imidazole ribonucleotide synthase [Sphingomonas vulcanisoli]|uniref:N5-carboxyaminoimidazole ribonucleotide synthase n=1 Tax=Sphingomonas vulcanisoli TaxID=1658060 RepID=A0ABX0TN73_9SPHN|nr:5-(carboxyamino)imidazole ribonucleotide synthase [Sphingomonas vulcanisoli]NIJ06558.1 5-(carboxyamino)imidazole ribonucleotide synthase [Sphingomonas vulcanisoli]
MISPGSTIGILGGGQLGRMLAIAAANLGYRTHIYAPGMSGPASEVAARWTAGRYEDAKAVAAFAAQVDVVTYEFENVVVDAIRGVHGICPSARSLEVSQDRAIEKAFAEEQGGRPAPWRAVGSLEELNAALAEIGAPAILKTRRFGYDGKGQVRIASAGEAAGAWVAIKGAPAVLEGMIAFDAEFSILLARREDGSIVTWDAVENEHRDGILRCSSVPASAPIAAQAAEAKALAGRIAGALDHVGVLACEFFATADGPVFNEMAPRVHNSGHWTIEGAVTSQFENHIRAICGLPLGSTALVGARAEMRNLLGDEVENWPTILTDPTAHLHLYGKGKGRPGRKMGHVTRVG